MREETWRMRRLTANEHPQLWHLEVDRSNGKYITACGLRYGMAGSAFKHTVPAGVCFRCLAKADRITRCSRVYITSKFLSRLLLINSRMASAIMMQPSEARNDPA